MKIVKALPVSVYRDNYLGDCTNNGITSRYDRVYLIGDDVDGFYEIDLDNPPANVLRLVRKATWGNEEVLRAVPLDNGDIWYMMGGNFIYTSDSRFPSRYPIPVHDRCETAEQMLMND